VTAIPAIAMAYAIDSYKPIAGELLVSATINKVNLSEICVDVERLGIRGIEIYYLLDRQGRVYCADHGEQWAHVTLDYWRWWGVVYVGQNCPSLDQGLFV